jgi:hypothetical protein
MKSRFVAITSQPNKEAIADTPIEKVRTGFISHNLELLLKEIAATGHALECIVFQNCWMGDDKVDEFMLGKVCFQRNTFTMDFTDNERWSSNRHCLCGNLE